jgi:hypothetical protein
MHPSETCRKQKGDSVPSPGVLSTAQLKLLKTTTPHTQTPEEYTAGSQ